MLEVLNEQTAPGMFAPRRRWLDAVEDDIRSAGSDSNLAACPQQRRHSVENSQIRLSRPG